MDKEKTVESNTDGIEKTGSFPLQSWVSWQWWSERVVPVYEGNWYEWVAPRWYMVIVFFAYVLLLAGFIKALIVVAS